MSLLLTLLAAAASASEPCALPVDLVAQAEQAVVEGRFDDMPDIVAAFEAGLGCAPPVDPAVLAAFLRAEGAWFHLTGLPDESQVAFRSAAALAPDVWTPAFGASVRAVFEAASATADPGPGRLALEPMPADASLVVHVNGAPFPLPAPVPSGIHAVQIVRAQDAHHSPGTARFGSLVAVFPGEDVRVNPGVLPVEERIGLESPAQSRPTWMLGAAGGAVLLSGLTAAVALSQPTRAEEAHSLAEVNAAERRQKAMAFTSYGSFGAALVAGGLYFAW